MGKAFKNLSYADRPIKAILRDGTPIWRRAVATRKARALGCEDYNTLIFVYDSIAWTPGMEIMDDSEGFEMTYTVSTVYDVPDNVRQSSAVPWLEISDMYTVVCQPSFYGFKPTSTAYGFYECSGMTDFRGMQYLNMEEVAQTCSMFAGCENYDKDIDISYFLLHSIEDTSYMFADCRRVQSITLGDRHNNFLTDYLEDTTGMFSGCEDLQEIKSDINFSEVSGLSSDNMFYGCFHLPNFDSDTVDATNARTGEGGYFVAYDDKVAKVIVDTNSARLVFVGDDLDYVVGHEYEIGGVSSIVTVDAVYELKRYTIDHEECPWIEWDGISDVCFAPSMEGYAPLSTNSGFNGLNDLENLENGDLINFMYLTSAVSMFEGTNMSFVSFESGETWFGRLTNTSHMFAFSTNLEGVSLTQFYLVNVEDSSKMFSDCSNLVDIYVGAERFDFTFTEESDDMFKDCENLPNYDPNMTDKEGARLVPLGYFQEA